MDIYTIYKATNTINGKSYIGFTKNFNKRVKDHIGDSRYSKCAIHRAIKKYGPESFNWEILYQSKDFSHTKNEMENHFILEYNTHVDIGHGYNMTLGGDGLSFPSIETRKKIGDSSKLRTGRPCSEETRKKIGYANSNKKLSENQKQFLKEINTGKKQSEETIMKKCKHYIITDPNGTEFEVYNMNRFCKENGLNQGAMAAVARGVNNHYKLWKAKQI